jgi:hypothetical protein
MSIEMKRFGPAPDPGQMNIVKQGNKKPSTTTEESEQRQVFEQRFSAGGGGAWREGNGALSRS